MNVMMKKGVYIFVAFVAIALASEIEDAEQKKRGAGKANALNSIPTGAQKTDYSYNVYPQTQSSQISSQSYQSQVPSSFYPTQTSSQYYSPANTPEASITNTPHSQVSHQGTQSQFVPINFIPNPGYQSKYQIAPKPNGNVQLAILQHPQTPATSIYPHSFFSSNPASQIGHSALLGSLGQNHFSFAPSYQPLSFGGHFLSQPSAMVVLPQPHPTLYNNLVYPNPTQSFYNYYPSSSQAKYSYASGSSPSSEYEKVQPSIPESVSKEDNGINVQGTDYISSSDTSSAYKNAYNSRNSYSKI